MEKIFTKNKIPEYGERLLKISCPLVLNYFIFGYNNNKYTRKKLITSNIFIDR